MKTMRYRIRVIALVLVIAILGVMLWCARALFFPDLSVFPLSPENPSVSPSVSPSLPASPDPWITTPDPASLPQDPWATLPQPDLSPSDSGVPAEITPVPSQAPLFDTFGL